MIKYQRENQGSFVVVVLLLYGGEYSFIPMSLQPVALVLSTIKLNY